MFSVFSLRSTCLCIKIFIAMLLASQFAYGFTFRDHFEHGDHWNGAPHPITNGVLQLSRSVNDKLTTRIDSFPPISTYPLAVRFRAKPSDGTPNYASLRIHFFTNDQGALNADSYSLHLTGDHRGHFKISKSGYKTEYYSGENNGLLIGPGEWQEVEIIFYRERIYVYRGDENVLNLHLPDMPLSPMNQHISLEAQSGNWDFDWFEVDTPNNDCDNGGGDNGGENQPPSIPQNLTVLSVSSSTAQFQWGASNDDSQVAGYILYRDQIEIARTQGLNYIDNNLQPSTTYQYTVQAYDDQDALSGQSSLLTIMTDPLTPNVITIQSIDDQVVDTGALYTYTPTVQGAGNITWVKEYGPDDLEVNASTGTVTWNIPSQLPSESVYVGVTAMDEQGNRDTEIWIVSIGNQQNIQYVGPNEANVTIADGVRSMSSGGTLIIRNGTYTGEPSDFINPNDGGAQPPAGNALAYTTIMAEEPGQVILDGQGNIEALMHITGNYNEPDDWGNATVEATPRNYIALKGMHIKNALSGGLRLSSLHHAKVTHVGVSDSGREANCDFTGPACGMSNIYITRTHHVLLEDVYTFGHGRYQIIFQKNRDGVIRRAVSRIDGYIGQEPVGVFQTYCSKNIYWQNVMAIDSDSKRFWVRHDNLGNAFGFAATNCLAYPTNSHYISSIALNNDVPYTGLNLDNANSPHYVTNSVGWGGDMTRTSYGTGSISSFIMGEGVIHLTQNTLGRVRANPGYETVEGGSGRGFIYHRNNPLTLDHSIVYQMGWNGSEVTNQGRLAWSSSDISFNFANLFDNSPEPLIPPGNNGGSISMTNTLTFDPSVSGLKYLPRIEAASTLLTAGEANQRVGALIQNRLGRSGTLHGEAGWNDETDIPLWPYPHESLIKQKFSNYSYTGPTRSGIVNTVGPMDTISGQRGFAAEGNGLYGGPITLTSYIWEQLGHPCPIEICTQQAASEPPPPAGNLNLAAFQPVADAINLNALNANVPSQSSGITWHGEAQQFLVVHNNHAKITRYNANWDQYLGIVSKGGNINSDMEGLAYEANDQLWVVAENNRAHRVAFDQSTTLVNGNETVNPGYLFPAPSTSSKGFEGVAIRPAIGGQPTRIYVGEEGTSQATAPFKIYYFDMTESLNQPNTVNEPYDVNEMVPFDAHALLGADIADISGMTYDPVSQHLIIVSQASSKLIEVDPDSGTIVSSLLLDKTDLNINWEGVTLGPNREIVVVGEPYYVRVYQKN